MQSVLITGGAGFIGRTSCMDGARRVRTTC